MCLIRLRRARRREHRATHCPRRVPLCAVGERVSKHRVSALGLFLCSLVLNDIPVLKQDSVFHADNIRRNPVDRQPEAREAAVDDDEVSLRYG